VPWQENRATLSPKDIPKVAHPYQAFLIKCDLADFIKVLKAHAEYWKGIRYDDKNVTTYLPTCGTMRVNLRPDTQRIRHFH
jgi:hypothetical protein